MKKKFDNKMLFKYFFFKVKILTGLETKKIKISF